MRFRFIGRASNAYCFSRLYGHDQLEHAQKEVSFRSARSTVYPPISWAPYDTQWSSTELIRLKYSACKWKKNPGQGYARKILHSSACNPSNHPQGCHRNRCSKRIHLGMLGWISISGHSSKPECTLTGLSARTYHIGLFLELPTGKDGGRSEGHCDAKDEAGEA